MAFYVSGGNSCHCAFLLHTGVFSNGQLSPEHPFCNCHARLAEQGADAVYLTYKRSPYYALGYAANDIVLIVLCILAARQNTSYLSVVVCFTAFLVNDIYGFINWCRMGERQAESV